jgi:hypothetical protein
MDESLKYRPERTDARTEAVILIRRFGATEAAAARIIADLGMSYEEAVMLVHEHAEHEAAASRSFLKDKALLLMWALLLGCIAGLFLLLSAPRAAMAGTLPFTLMIGIGILSWVKRRRT